MILESSFSLLENGFETDIILCVNPKRSKDTSETDFYDVCGGTRLRQTMNVIIKKSKDIKCQNMAIQRGKEG